MIYLNSQKGYTLLFSVIVATIVLSIGAFILSISRKQFILSSAARDSTKAIYAADSGIQCAIETYNGGNVMNNFLCNGASQQLSFDTLDPTIDSNMFALNPSPQSAGPFFVYFTDNGSCAKVLFASGTDPISHTSKMYMKSLGYNMSKKTTNICPVISPRTVERGIYLIYN